MSREEIVHAYRHLLRHSLRAIHFSKPARYTLRDRLRLAFRKGDAADFNAQKVANTVEFLNCAERETGLEHLILRNLLYVWFHQTSRGPKVIRKVKDREAEINTTAYDTFNHHIRMLNETTGMCLPAMTVLSRS